MPKLASVVHAFSAIRHSSVMYRCGISGVAAPLRRALPPAPLLALRDPLQRSAEPAAVRRGACTPRVQGRAYRAQHEACTRKRPVRDRRQVGVLFAVLVRRYSRAAAVCRVRLAVGLDSRWSCAVGTRGVDGVRSGAAAGIRGQPALGLLGKGLSAFRRVEEDYVDHEGTRFTADELYDFLCRQADANLFATDYSHYSLGLGRTSHKAIVQERLHAHPAVAELTGSQRLVPHAGSSHARRRRRAPGDHRDRVQVDQRPPRRRQFRQRLDGQSLGARWTRKPGASPKPLRGPCPVTFSSASTVTPRRGPRS